jgi:pimeloyl-ACP methyl ester carboxylesterase
MSSSAISSPTGSPDPTPESEPVTVPEPLVVPEPPTVPEPTVPEPTVPEPTVLAGSAEIVVHKRTFVQGRPAVYSVAGSGMPVVLLHGWALADNTYRNVITRIAAQGCRVIAPAMPGFGGTHDLPKQQFSIGGYARWLADLLEALELDEPAVVVGHSFGGGVAIRFAHDHQRRVRSLVLVNSVGGSSWRRGEVIRSISERPLWDWGLHFPADVWPIRQASRVLPVIIGDLVPNIFRNPVAIARVANLARRADLRSELETLRNRGLPITILWGSRDGVIPRESFEAMCVAAGVEGTVVDGSHSWLLADPDQFGEVITNDMRVAKLARELEQQTPKKRRAIRRVASLIPEASPSGKAGTGDA